MEDVHPEGTGRWSYYEQCNKSELPAYITKKNKQEGAMYFERRNQNLGSRVDGAQAVGAAVFTIDPCG
ncbi:hypothetical protein J23TS9_22920 [Paenibacillus sp. J23TS9]|nr:hypothetical protein J23TS9_22920 [Paenibacillus sp. J23TS9]